MNRRTLLSQSVVALTAFALFPASGHAGFSLFAKHKGIKSSGDAVHIPVKKVNDGKAHYYSYKSSGKSVNFFVVKSDDNVIRAAFDACDVCFPAKKGYSQDGDVMICNNCGRRFHTSRINVEKGGCNPAPLQRTVVGDELVIKVADIAPGGRFF
jgi:uncharacterized membrane protein